MEAQQSENLQACSHNLNKKGGRDLKTTIISNMKGAYTIGMCGPGGGIAMNVVDDVIMNNGKPYIKKFSLFYKTQTETHF